MNRIALAFITGIALAALVVSFRGGGVEKVDLPPITEEEVPVATQPQPAAATTPSKTAGHPVKATAIYHEQLDTQPFSGNKPDSYLADLTPTNIGPDLTPESAYPVEDTVPKNLGEYIDPEDPVHYLNRTDNRKIAIGEFIDPDAP